MITILMNIIIYLFIAFPNQISFIIRFPLTFLQLTNLHVKMLLVLSHTFLVYSLPLFPLSVDVVNFRSSVIIWEVHWSQVFIEIELLCLSLHFFKCYRYCYYNFEFIDHHSSEEFVDVCWGTVFHLFSCLQKVLVALADCHFWYFINDLRFFKIFSLTKRTIDHMFLR